MAITKTETVEIDGEEHEIEVEVDPSEYGYLDKDTHKERVSEERAKVRQAEREKAEGKISLDRLGEDEELQEELRERYPEMFRASDSGGGEETLTEEDLDRFQEKWKRENLEPVAEERDQLAEEAKKLRVEKLDREVVEAAGDMGFRDDPGVRRALKLIARDEMGYSEEDAEWYRRDSDGFEISTSDETDARYVTVREFLEELKNSGEYDGLLASGTREGAGYGGSEGGGGSDTARNVQEMSEQEKMDFIDEHGQEKWNELVRKSYQNTG